MRNHAAIGRKGGIANVAKHGIDHMRVIGQVGGEHLVADRGAAHYAAIGRMGGRPPGGRMFSDDEVLAIRTDAANGVPYTTLAKAWGTGRNTISDLVRGVTYQDVPE